MIDTQRIKDRIDCRTLIERDLGRPKSRTHNYSTYKCPLHHEERGFSLVVYPDGWYCFGKCGGGGDAIAWLEAYHHLSFHEACERLAVGTVPTARPLQVKSMPPASSEPPAAEWQRAARTLADMAAEMLWSPGGQRALHYLKYGRGLSENTILAAGLGYIPGHYHEWKRLEALNVPCGITIPWIADGALWGVKVRRSAGQIRYQQISGGNIRGALYLADTITPGLPLLLTEGEFDALTAAQVGTGLISAAAIGSATHKHLHSRWFSKVMSAPSLLICMDADPAGQAAADHLCTLSHAARCVYVPEGKDLNDFALRAGVETSRAWIEQIR